jgi:hypothetical protein
MRRTRLLCQRDMEPQRGREALGAAVEGSDLPRSGHHGLGTGTQVKPPILALCRDPAYVTTPIDASALPDESDSCRAS